MKKLLFIIAFLFTVVNSFSQVYVQGYTRSNGTYVQGYYRTAPNNTRNDNYSTVGNVNPYTGTAGTKPRDYSTSTYTTPVYRNTTTYSTPSYTAPVSTYTSTYSSPTYYSTSTYSAPKTIYTGSRGGTYYINSNGNKTYVKN